MWEESYPERLKIISDAFRAVKAQMDASIAGYVRVQKVTCLKCRVAYDLFAEENVGQSKVHTQVETLRKYLAFVCPNHAPDVTSAPDPRRPE